MTELVAHEEIDEAVAISTCNRTEIYLVDRATRCAPRPSCWASSPSARRHPPDRARPGRLLAAQLRRRAPALPRRPRGLESMIVGEAEVQGQVTPRLRGRARGRHHRADDQPPVQRRAAGRQARAHGDRHRRASASASRPSPSTSPATSSATSTSRSVVIIGAGETAELTAQALADQGVRDVFVANRHADRARSLAERFGGEVGSLDALPGAPATRPTSSSPRPPRRTRSSRPTSSPRSCGARDGRPLVLIDIAVPRDIEHACGELDGVTRLRHRRPAGRRRAQPRACARPSARAPRRSSRRRSSASRAGWRSSTSCRRSPRCASTAPRSSTRSWPRTRAAGRRVAARPRARRGGGARGHAAAAARADDPPEGERRTAASRSCASCSGSTRRPRRPAPPAEAAPEAPAADNVRPLKRRA